MPGDGNKVAHLAPWVLAVASPFRVMPQLPTPWPQTPKRAGLQSFCCASAVPFGEADVAASEVKVGTAVSTAADPNKEGKGGSAGEKE